MSEAEPSLADQIAEVRREIELRRRTYVRLLAIGKMKPADAERHMTNILAVLRTLEEVRDMRLTIARAMT